MFSTCGHDANYELTIFVYQKKNFHVSEFEKQVELYDIFIYGINNYSVQVTICDMYVVRKFHMGREGLLTPYMSY